MKGNAADSASQSIAVTYFSKRPADYWGCDMIDDLKRIQVDSPDALWGWLLLNHNCDASYLLVTWKKSRKEKYISREEVLDALIAYGWIDGRRYALDEERTMQLICKRKQQKWTQSYRERAEKLATAGLMHMSGLTVVNEAKASGTWLINVDVDELICPSDLLQALKMKKAESWWNDAAPSYKRNLLRWLSSAKKETTRQKRCDEIATACGERRKIKNM